MDALCPKTANVSSRKCGGVYGCQVTKCSEHFVDVDQSYATGCEIKQDRFDVAGSGNACGTAPGSVEGGTLREWGGWAKNGSDLYVARGNIAPAGDSDWYRVVLKDEPPSTPEARYDFGAWEDGAVRLTLTLDPADGTFVYDVYQGSCTTRVITAGGNNCQSGCDTRGPPGSYWVRVYALGGAKPRDYALHLRAVPSPGAPSRSSTPIRASCA